MQRQKSINVFARYIIYSLTEWPFSHLLLNPLVTIHSPTFIGRIRIWIVQSVCRYFNQTYVVQKVWNCGVPCVGQQHAYAGRSWQIFVIQRWVRLMKTGVLINAKKKTESCKEFVRYILWSYWTAIRFVDLQSMLLLGSDSEWCYKHGENLCVCITDIN